MKSDKPSEAKAQAHSPAPWRGSINGSITAPSGVLIAQVYGNPGEDEALRNIEVITAAPELLAACREMQTVLESVADLAPDFLDNEKGHFSKLVASALQAAKKAMGEL